jgi:hypothetical protein
MSKKAPSFCPIRIEVIIYFVIFILTVPGGRQENDSLDS